MPLMWCSCIKVFLCKKEPPRFVRKIILTFNFEGQESTFQCTLINRVKNFSWEDVSFIQCSLQEGFGHCCVFFVFSDEFENVIKKTTFFNKIIFDFDTEFVKTYFGKEKKAHVRFDDFSHLLQVCSIFIIPTVSSIVIYKNNIKLCIRVQRKSVLQPAIQASCHQHVLAYKSFQLAPKPFLISRIDYNPSVI